MADLRRSVLVPYWRQLWLIKSYLPVLLVPFGTSLWLIVRYRRLSDYRMPTFLISFAFVLATYGREFTYFIYFFPLLCFGMGLLLERSQRRSLLLAIIGLAYIISVLLAVRNYRKAFSQDYETVARQLRDVIPPGKSVFIGLSNFAPTPYFALYNRNPMGTIAPVPLPDGYSHGKVAASCDYIVTISPPEFPTDADILTQERVTITIQCGSWSPLYIYKLR